MKRAFTNREKVLLVILVVLVIGIGYFKLILEPINSGIADYQAETSAEQDELLQNAALLARMNQMRQELAQIHAAGEAKPLPDYDHADALLIELNTILRAANDYSLTFGNVAPMENETYIMRRPLNLTFTASSYTQARSILDALHASGSINQISDLSVSFQQDGTVDVSALVSFFELNG